MLHSKNLQGAEDTCSCSQVVIARSEDCSSAQQIMTAPAPGADYAALREQYATTKQEELEAEEGGLVSVRNSVF